MRGKILVVTSVLVVGLAAVGFSGPLSGVWSVIGNLEYDTNEQVHLTSFESLLDIDYTVGGWTLGAVARLTRDYFDFIFFDAMGSVGAIDFYSKLVFYTRYNRFHYWGNLVTLSIAGLDLYTILFASNRIFIYRQFVSGIGWANVGTITATDSIGTGLLVGGWGDFGDCTIYGQVRYNATLASGWMVYAYGYDWVRNELGFHNEAYSGIGCHDYWNWVGEAAFLPQTASCGLCWSGFEVGVFYPFACFDLTTSLYFTCEEGFDYARFQFEDICLGLDWLELEKLRIEFDVQTKSVGTYFCLEVADCVCFTPYLSLVPSQYGTSTFIDGIALNALTLRYDMGQGVTFKAGTLFATGTGIAVNGFTGGWWWYGCAEPWYSSINLFHAFTETGEVISTNEGGSLSCVYNIGYDEYFGVFIDGDSCCGGVFDVWIMNWFEDSQTGGFMDWAETVGNLSIGIGSNTTLNLKISLTAPGLPLGFGGLGVTHGGLNWLKVGIDFLF